MSCILSRNAHSVRASPRSQPVARPAFHSRLRRISCASADKSSATVSASSGSSDAGASSSANKYNWTFENKESSAPRGDGRLVVDLPIAAIRRPLGRTRGNDQEKVAALMESIQEIGLQEPIDVLEVDGVYYGFSGCHRFEAHQRLGAETIRCRVRKATKEVLKMHLM